MTITNLNMQDNLQGAYESLLLGYAAGMLDQAQNLAVAAHLSYSASAQNYVRRCEAVGGVLIEDHCQPVSMNEHALGNVLERLDKTPPAKNDSHPPCALNLGFEIPKPLKDTLAQNKTPEKWTTLFPGMKGIDIKLKCKKSHAQLIKVKPGTQLPHHRHQGIEITLVLDGAFHDEGGAYNRGDLIVTDETTDHAPTACEKHGCVCLIVNSAPIRLTGIASILNPFLK